MQKATVDKNSREYLTRKVTTARHTLLLVIIFTVINLGMVLADTGRYFLFSASVPYELTFLGAVMNYEATGAIIGTYTITALVMALAVLALYFVCWLLAKKRPGLWYTVAFVLFALDTGVMLLVNLEYIAEYIMDIVFHFWVLVELFQAITANKKLQAMPAAEGEAIPPMPQEPWERKDIE